MKNDIPQAFYLIGRTDSGGSRRSDFPGFIYVLNICFYLEVVKRIYCFPSAGQVRLTRGVTPLEAEVKKSFFLTPEQMLPLLSK